MISLDYGPLSVSIILSICVIVSHYIGSLFFSHYLLSTSWRGLFLKVAVSLLGISVGFLRNLMLQLNLRKLIVVFLLIFRNYVLGQALFSHAYRFKLLFSVLTIESSYLISFFVYIGISLHIIAAFFVLRKRSWRITRILFAGFVTTQLNFLDDWLFFVECASHLLLLNFGWPVSHVSGFLSINQW